MGAAGRSCDECLAEMKLMEDMQLVLQMDPGFQPTLPLPHSSFPSPLGHPHPPPPKSLSGKVSLCSQ